MKALRKSLLILLLLIAVGQTVSGKPAATEVDSLIEQASALSKRGQFGEVATPARRLLAIGREQEDRKALLYGWMYMGHSLAGEPNDSVRYYYGRALDLAARSEDYRALTAINNSLAIYTSEIEMNYLGGLSYFMEALKYAELSPDKHSYPVVLSNLAMAYYLRGDASGLKYSLEAFEIGTATGDPLLIYSGSFVTAYMYYLLGDYTQALRYIETAIGTDEQYVEYVEAYSLYANILVRLGREQEAVRYYRRSLELVGSEKSNTLAYLNYGNYLIEKQRPREAVGVLEKGLDFVDRRNNAFYRHRLYEKLSEAHELAGQKERALEYYKLFHRDADSIFSVGRERAINELRVQYESEKQEREIREKELALLHERQKLNVALFVAILLVGVVVGLWVSNRRKNRRYRQIATQQHELMRRERAIEQQQEADKYTVSSLSDEKGVALFAAFEQLMGREKPYRESNVTIEKIAQMLSTNRSYLSQAINENSGISFSQYIDRQRIAEARRVLSDADNDVRIKELAYRLGFSSPDTFSASFHKAIGMPPSKFREQMQKLLRR